MVSRRDSIKRAGKFIGLAAAHFALFGQSFREGMLYEMEAREIVTLRKLNDNEIELLVDTARARGTKKIQDHFATPGKTQRAGFNATMEYFDQEIERLVNDLLS